MMEKHTRFHGQYWTVPNLLSYIRLGIIPLIIHTYCVAKNYYVAAAMVALSGATDVIDGWIARHYHLVTDWGKIIDPIADKLTQIAVALCLAWRFIAMRYLLVLLVAKEIYMGIIGMVFIHKTDTVEGSFWIGKLTTVLFFCCAMILLLFPALPEEIKTLALCIEAAFILLSMGLYTIRLLKLYKEFKVSHIR